MTTHSSESRQTEVLTVAWVMTGTATLIVGIKLFARVKIVRAIGWDDFFIFFSLVRPPHFVVAAYDIHSDYLQVLSIIASSFVHYGVVLGFGRHTTIVAAEFGDERLFKTAKFQMLGYRMYTKVHDPSTQT